MVLALIFLSGLGILVAVIVRANWVSARCTSEESAWSFSVPQERKVIGEKPFRGQAAGMRKELSHIGLPTCLHTFVMDYANVFHRRRHS